METEDFKEMTLLDCCRNAWIESEKEREEFIDVDEDGITLDGYYFVEKSQCNTYDKILGWVVHFTEKNWFTVRRIRWFVQAACVINNIKVPY